MFKFFVDEKNFYNDHKTVEIIDDVNHIKNVLRMKKEDKIQVCNRQTGENYYCEIMELNQDKVLCSIIDEINEKVESDIEITICQGLPKAEKMELIIQKSVEIGVKDIIPLKMDRCVVKLNEKDVSKKIERWNRISETAAKQSGRNYISKIKNPVGMGELLNKIKEFDYVLVAYENEKEITLKQVLKEIKEEQSITKNENPEKTKIAIIIGPEGGITELEIDELKKKPNVKIISLGSRILRTETVALVMSSIIIYELES